MAGSRHKYPALLRLAVATGELLLAGLAGWAAAQGQVSAPVTIDVVSADGTTLAPPAPPSAADANVSNPGAATAAKGITTVEGLWTFGTPPDAAGDYPVLLNGSNAPNSANGGGFAVRLQVTNGNLYAKTKAGKFSVRWPAGTSWVASAAPAEGTAATAVSLAVVLPQILDNSPAGTLVATAAVTMTPAGATFTGPLVSSNPLFTAQGANIVLSRAVTPADDGTVPPTIRSPRCSKIGGVDPGRRRAGMPARDAGRLCALLRDEPALLGTARLRHAAANLGRRPRLPPPLGRGRRRAAGGCATDGGGAGVGTRQAEDLASRIDGRVLRALRRLARLARPRAGLSALCRHLVEVIREVRRVLRADGTLWLNLGDCYAPAPARPAGRRRDAALSKLAGQHGNAAEPHAAAGLKPKDLVGIPWRVAFALQDDGWWLRRDHIWAKPNPMPESVRDRCTTAHEYLFLLTKSARYYYDGEAIKEPLATVRAGDYPGRAKDRSRRRAARSARRRPPTITDGFPPIAPGATSARSGRSQRRRSRARILRRSRRR